MNRGPRYLLASCCLLISLASAQAQQAQPRRPAGFVPKHEQMQRLRHAKRNSQPQPNPFANQVKLAGGAGAMANQTVEKLSHNETIIDTSVPFNESVACQCDDCAGMPAGAVPSCGAPGCGASPCGPSCYQPIFWVGAEYLLWSTRDADSPALASTSVANTDREAAGVLGEPGSSTLFGGDGMHGDVRSGARFTLGGWFSPARTAGIEVTYFAFEEDEESFSGSLSEFPILARPFHNVELLEEDSRLINFPDVVRGDLTIRSTSDFNSLEIMFLRPAAVQAGGCTNLMLGYRNVDLDESIRFDETTTSLVSPTLGSRFVLFDRFDVENSFHGGQIGVRHVGQLGPCWKFDLLGKASLGSTRSRLRIDGSRATTTSAGDVSTTTGGLLALRSNIGTHTDSEFGSVFELGFAVRRRYQNGLQLKIGYTYLHWSSVQRAVEQIDREINPTQVPPDTLIGLVRPRVLFERSGFWAQGLNLGLEYQF